MGLLLYMLLFTLFILFHIPFSFYYIFTLGICLFIIIMELEYKQTNNKEERTLLRFEWFLSEIRHRYYVHGMVDEAVKEAMDACPYSELKLEISKIHAVLISNDSKIAMTNYRISQSNRFYCMFVTLCLLVIEFGDQKFEGNSLFLHNIKNLREEVHMDIQSRRFIRNTFAGLTFVLLLPICTLKLIEAWGISNLSELTVYYHGNYSIIFYLCLFVLTACLYYLFYIVKVPYHISIKTHEILKWLLTCAFVKRLVHNYTNHYYYRVLRLNRLLKEVGENMEASMFLIQRLVMGCSAFLVSVILSIYMCGGYYRWYYGVICAIVAVIVYWIPYLLLLYRRKAMLLCMEEEVLQFHSILMMLMYFPRISVYELLEAMEEFAVIFKHSLKQCLLEYESGQREALLRLKQREHCTSFQRLVDNLLMCDEVGVVRALDEVSIERNYHREKRKQVSDFQIQKKGYLCQFLAFLPLFFTVGFYLIIPFVTVSITKLLQISNEVLNG